jgi:hypothetical protein
MEASLKASEDDAFAGVDARNCAPGEPIALRSLGFYAQFAESNPLP